MMFFLSLCFPSQAPSFLRYIWVRWFPLLGQSLVLQVKTVSRKNSTIFDQQDDSVTIQELQEKPKKYKR